LPPVFIPGTPENNAVARSIGKTLEDIVGAIGRLPRAPSPKRRDGNDDECEEQLRKDMIDCQTVKAVKGASAGAVCRGVAQTRYSECLRFGVKGIRTPPYW